MVVARDTCSGAGVRRHLPVAKDGPCAGTKGYRAPEVRTLSPLHNSTVMYLIQLSVQVAITSSPPNFLDQHIVALSLHYSSSETQASSCGA